MPMRINRRHLLSAVRQVFRRLHRSESYLCPLPHLYQFTTRTGGLKTRSSRTGRSRRRLVADDILLAANHSRDSST
jgi:hypothetical protein